jgi:hypothetical protein
MRWMPAPGRTICAAESSSTTNYRQLLVPIPSNISKIVGKYIFWAASELWKTTQEVLVVAAEDGCTWSAHEGLMFFLHGIVVIKAPLSDISDCGKAVVLKYLYALLHLVAVVCSASL